MRPLTTYDITQGSLAHNVWHLAWPITLSQMLFMLPSLFDAVWLGRLGPGAQAAAGLTMSVRITMISVLMALSAAGGAVVARYVGRREYDQANLATLQAILLMVAASGLLGLVGILLVEPLMSLGGADAATLPLAVRYARIIFAGLIAMELVPSLSGVLNAAGEAKISLGMTLCTTVALLLGEPLLVWRWGLEGAALAMVGAHVVGMSWGLGVLLSGRAAIRIDLQNLRLNFAIMGRILRIALPAVLWRGTPNLAMALLTRLVAAYGPATLAAWVVARRIFDFALIPGMGLSRVAPAMVGQNLGAAQPQRATDAVGLMVRLATLITAAILVALALCAPQAMALFSEDGETIAAGTQMIWALSLGYLAFTLSTVFESAQAGAGDTVSPMVINLVALWLVQIPLAYFFSQALALQANGIWVALVLGWIVQAALMYWRFRQGRWKLNQI